MQRIVSAAALVVLVSLSARAEIVVFVDGTQMEVSAYEVKGAMFVITTTDGKLRSVPASYVNLEATERANRGAGQTAAPPPEPKLEPPAESPLPIETVEPEPVIPPPSPDPAPAPMPDPAPPPAPPATSPVPPASAPAPSPDVPPPVWSNDEIQVSVVVPSPAWRVEDMTTSFDVAVALENAETEARATLGLVRRRMRSYRDFQEVVTEIETSVTASPGFQPLGSQTASLPPYTVHEIRFTKDFNGRTLYNWLVVFYSQDLAYVLSMNCPYERYTENEADFKALVGGVVIKKTRRQLAPRGAPRELTPF